MYREISDDKTEITKTKTPQKFSKEVQHFLPLFFEVNINKCSVNSYAKRSLKMSGVKIYAIPILKLRY